jgi:hypothetical protein
MRNASGAPIPDHEVRSGRGCIVVSETPKGSFDVVHQLSLTRTTADGVSCDIAHETLRRSLARIASGNVAVLK